MEATTILFLVLLFNIAVLYSTVGHGGASGYLALMGLFHFTPEVMRPSALVLNIVVSLIAAWQYSRTEKINFKLLFWLLAGSLPAAFLGAMINLDTDIYKKILGIIVLIHSLQMFGLFAKISFKNIYPSPVPVFFAGSAIGFISGIIGIGGGIFLSPLLIITGWASIRQTTLISACFICLNSFAGLGGLMINGIIFSNILYIWLSIAICGGLLGSWLGSRKLSPLNLKKILGLVLFVAGVKLILS